ncbi:metacaspase-3 [Plasmodium brasilianum]|uniref:Metacaspase-like protein n=2 Tax=Plasmodium (Plasmodium) TaxID=418103 RepID=A0A1A8WA32_PLAMA|nr:metacaspase-like protein [Plasmodium malariae]KAI4835838.1 metacaspase-3 [Plasmodium brasilianum]SBS89706.1 hypothetical protein, conserved [Plasmodium malariae]SCP02775.1 metacaspase-like protein [Plasmodium malariae]
MGNYDNININGSKKDDRRFTSSVKKSTSLKSSLTCHEKKTKSYKLDKHSDEDKCKLNEKYASCKISNEKKKLLKSMKKVSTKGYCMDKFKTVSRNVECYNRMSKITHKGNSSKRAQTVSRKIARNSNNNANGSNSNSNSNSNSSNIRKIINLRRKELPSTLNSICSRPDNRRKSILKKDIHHYVEENVKKKNSDHDRVKNENSNSNEQIIGKMIINKGSIDLLSTYNTYNGIRKQENKNKCLHDEHALNLLETKTSITTKNSIKNEDIQIKQNKLEQINKINCYERNINNSVNHNSVKRVKERSNSAKMTILPKFELSNPSRVATLSHISSRDMPRGNHSEGYRIYENHVNGIAERRNVSSKRNSITAYRDVSCSSNVKEDMPNRHSDVLTNKYMSYLNKDCIIFLEKNRKMVNDNYIKGNFHNMLKYISHHNGKSDLVRKKGIHSIIEKGNENMHRNLLYSKPPDSIYEEGEVKFNCVKATTDDFNMQKGSYKYNKHFDHSEQVKPFKHLLYNSTSPIEMLNKELRTYKKYDHTDVDSKKNYTAKNFFINTNYDNFKKYSSLPNCSDNEIIANRYYTDNFYSKMLKNKNKDNLNGNTYSNCSRDFSRRKVINGKSHLKNGNYLESVNYVSCDKDISDPIKEEDSLNFYDNSNYRINWNSLKCPNSYKNYYTYNDLSQQVFRKNIYPDARDVNTNEFYKSYNNVLDRGIKNGIIASKICNGDDMMTIMNNKSDNTNYTKNESINEFHPLVRSDRENTLLKNCYEDLNNLSTFVKDNNYYSHINMNCFRTSPLRSNKCNKYEHVHISPNVTNSSKIVLQQYAEDGNLVGVKFPQNEREIDNNNNNKSNDDNNNNNSNNNDNNKLNKSSVHIFKKIYIDHNLSNIQNRNEYNADRKDNSERNILSSYVPLNMEHKISKIDDERFIKYDKNYIHEKNDNIINEKRNQTNDYQKKYTISNNSSTDECQSSTELKKYAFNEATYLSHECVLEKGKIESNPLRNYHTITDKVVPNEEEKYEQLRKNKFITNVNMLNNPMYIRNYVINNAYKFTNDINNNSNNQDDNVNMYFHNRRMDMVDHQNYTINNFLMKNEREESNNIVNMNTITFPLQKNNEIINDTLNKNIMLKNSINNSSSDKIQSSLVPINSNILHPCEVNGSISNTSLNDKKKDLVNSNVIITSSSNLKMKSSTLVNVGQSNKAPCKNVNSVNGVNSMNSVNNESNVMVNDDLPTTDTSLTGKRMNVSIAHHLNNYTNKNISCTSKNDTCTKVQNKGRENISIGTNNNIFPKTVVLHLNSAKSKDDKKKGLGTCKSICNSDIYNYLRNTHTKTLTNFHRTVSYRKQSSKMNVSDRAIPEIKLKNGGPLESATTAITTTENEVDTKKIVKKAVVIGCNYLNDVGGNRLYGSVNDAYIFCRALVKYFDFMPDNILLLTDSLPSNAYIYEDFDIDRKKYIKEEYIYANDEKKVEKNNFFNLFNKSSTYDKEKINTKMIDSNSCRNVDIKNVDFSSENISFNLWPTRINILKAVNWLVRDSAPFGSYVFYFAGKSVQVDNMSGWEGEGYDEAFLCSDPFSRNYAHNVITTVQLKDLLLSINISAQMTIILDCSGGQTILDPAGTENSLSYIKGCKQKGIWPIANPTNKVHKAVYDITILNHISMKKYFCKSRYSKLIEVESTSAMIDPLLQSISSLPVAPKAYCLCAATWEQTSIEGLFPTVEFARVTQIKPMIDLEQVGKNKKINEKKLGNKCEVGKNKHKKILSNVHKLGTEKKSIYEKNFSFSLNVMKLFFNNSTSGINNNSTNYNKDYDKMRKDEEENAEEKKIKHSSLHYDNDNNVKHAVSNESDDSDYSVNTTSNEEIFNNCKGKDNYVLVSHGVFTYCLIEAIIEFKEIELKNNIFEQRNAKFLPMTLKNLINVIQKKIQNVKNNKLKKLDQKPEFTIHPGANASTNNYFVHYSKNIHFQNYKCDFMHSDLSPFLNVNKAWEEINKNTLKNRKSLSVTSTLINTASSKYFTAESNKIKNSYSLRC